MAVDGGCVSWLAEGDGWTLHAVRWADGSGQWTVTAVDEGTGLAVLDRAMDGAAEPPAGDDGPVALGFWRRNRHGAVRNERRITADPWPDIRRNYTRRAAVALDELMALTAADVRGRLLLLHGSPGTGKTTALRALARAWRSWCQVDAVSAGSARPRPPRGSARPLARSGDGDGDGFTLAELCARRDQLEVIATEATGTGPGLYL